MPAVMRVPAMDKAFSFLEAPLAAHAESIQRRARLSNVRAAGKRPAASAAEKQPPTGESCPSNPPTVSPHQPPQRKALGPRELRGDLAQARGAPPNLPWRVGRVTSIRTRLLLSARGGQKVNVAAPIFCPGESDRS